jgi:acetyl-CoA carboxylase carboxyltransferase component
VADYLAEDERDAIRLGREIIAHLHWRKAARARPSAPARSRRLRSRGAARRREPDLRSRSTRATWSPASSTARASRSSSRSFGSHAGVRLGPRSTATRSASSANNGVLFSESAQKGAQFIQLCNQTDTPLVFLQNITGFMVGQATSRAASSRTAPSSSTRCRTRTVPAITVMTGASYGAGNYGMSGRAYGRGSCSPGRNHRIAVMGGEQLAGVLEIIKREAAAKSRRGRRREGSPDRSQGDAGGADRQGVDAYFATARLWDDGIIDPRDTRTVLALALEAAHMAPVEGTTSGC